MSIESDVKELQSLSLEIKNLNGKLRTLRNSKKLVEERITKYIHHKKLPGFKYYDLEITLQDKSKVKYKPRKQQVSDSAEILKRYNIKSPERVLQELQEAKKSEFLNEKSIKTKKIKNKN